VKTPYPFQRTAIERILSSAGFLLADDCGCGKTLVSVEVAKASRELGQNKVLLVLPHSAIAQWIETIHEQDPDYGRILVMNKIPWKLNDFEGYAIVTYPELFDDISINNLRTVLWDWVIADEGHRFKNRKTGTFKSIKNLNYVRGLVLTATPSETTSADYWALLHFVRPDIFKAFWGFVAKWIIKKPGYQNHWVLGGAKDPKAFATMLQPYVLQRARRDVMPDLPPMIIADIPVDFLPKQAEAYKQFKEADDILVPVQEKEFLVTNVLSFITKAHQVSVDPSLIGLKGYSGKLAWLDDWLSDHPNDPTVIFTRFRDLAIKLSEEYDGDLVVGGMGGVPAECFKTGKTRLIFGTIDAMGETLNLQRARHAIFLDAHWSHRAMKQATDRIDRMDITSPSTVYRLYSCYEDRLVLTAVDEKWNEGELVRKYLQGD